ncbi:MAG TPA: hypothetical protein VMW16_11270 [Sedimentisphaerales bacterium]|nr:hypothetical protein [Sedimentisphaerales bacterium]
MSKKRIKPSETDISERAQIINSFCDEINLTELLATDITDHKCRIEEVYKQMLHEKKVIDECRRRFEKTFKKGIDFVIFGVEV